MWILWCFYYLSRQWVLLCNSLHHLHNLLFIIISWHTFRCKCGVKLLCVSLVHVVGRRMDPLSPAHDDHLWDDDDYSSLIVISLKMSCSSSSSCPKMTDCRVSTVLTLVSTQKRNILLALFPHNILLLVSYFRVSLCSSLFLSPH